MEHDDNFTADAILHAVRAVFHPDQDVLEASEDGFYWWPGSHRVQLSCRPEHVNGELSYKLAMTTSVLRDFSITESKTANVVAQLSATAPTYSWVAPSNPGITDKQIAADGLMFFHSSIRVWPNTAPWVPTFFARLAIMQPIDAERLAPVLAEALGVTTDTDMRRARLKKEPIDEMLDVADAVFRPAGQEPSRWADVSEFERIAETYGRNDNCFGTGDNGGVTLETPFGDDTALIQLRSEVAHPVLGNGLLTSIQLPVSLDEESCAFVTHSLNVRAAAPGTRHSAFLGSWHPREVGNEWFPAYGAFLPNSVYRGGLATNMALWAVGLAQWAKTEMWSHLVDEPMWKILNKREFMMTTLG